MKRKYIFAFGLAVFALLLDACGSVIPPTDEGETFGFYRLSVQSGSIHQSNNPVSMTLSAPGDFNMIAKAVITIVDANDRLVTDSDVVQLFNFSGTYLSESVRIQSGTYRLTRYFVTDQNNNIIFATPLEDSSLASAVSDPLPMPFTVTADSTIDVVPEILNVEGHTAADFGYTGITFPDPLLLAYPSSTIIKNYNLGGNGIAFDGDDYCYTYSIQDYANYYTNGNDKLYNTVDGIIGNGNDTALGWWKIEPGFLKGSWRNGPGNDNAWFTDDDVIDNTEDWSAPWQGNVQYHPICTAPGPDQIWFTADDVQTGYFQDTADSNWNVVRRANYAGTGTNGVLTNTWFGAYYSNTYGNNGNNRWWSWTRQDRYNADNTLSGYVIHEFNDTRFPKFYTREIYYNPQGQVTRYVVAENTP